jgi:hypothetical protein
MEALLHASTTSGAEPSDTMQSPHGRLARPTTEVHITSADALSRSDETTTQHQAAREIPTLVEDSSPSIDPSSTFQAGFSSTSSLHTLQAPQLAARIDTDERALDPILTSSQKQPRPPQSDQEGPGNSEETEVPFQEGLWEQHVPGSWMSVCSQPGQRWVCKRTGSADFAESARGLTLSLRRRSMIEQDPSTSTVADELDEATAWRYVQAYFDHSYDALFGIINRPAFEDRLRGHFARGSAQYDEPSWVALRNVVFAAGCRCHLAKESSVSFVQARAQAWQFFDKALAVLKDIIFHTKGLVAVQALALMVRILLGQSVAHSDFLRDIVR